MKDVRFVGSSQDDLRAMPKGVRGDFGYELEQVAKGEMPSSAKVLQGFGGAEVLELRTNDEAGTYRAVYTVRFKDAVYVLHCFQKKSTKGAETSKRDMDLVHARLKQAQAWSGEG
jgi:phage-related protein